MDQKDRLMMTSKDIHRLQILKKVVERSIRQVKSAEILGLSTRQIRRLLERMKLEGAKGILHKLRGRPGTHHLKESLRRRVIGLYREHYKGFGPTLAAEKLLERHALTLSDETLRLWLIQEGLWIGHRRRRLELRQWRPPKAYF